MAKKNIRDIELNGKKVLMRVDFNVPMKNGVITDTNRIVQALPTINYALDHGAKLILFSHLGRVKEEADLAKNDLAPVAKKLEELLKKPVKFINATRGKELEDAINNMKNGEVVMFQNTRYEDLNGKKESKNDPELGAYWASLGDVFVNDAFGTAHRDAASNTGIAAHIKGASVSGFLLEKEIKFIGGAVDNPVHPFVAILGGAKVSDKISVIENLLNKADKVMICGAMAYTFFKALGYEVGGSKCELDFVDYAKGLLEKANGKIILPVDVVIAKPDKDEVAKDFFGAIAKAPTKVVKANEIPADWEGLDCGPDTIKKFASELVGAKTVVWNGPLGYTEVPEFAQGTEKIAKYISHTKAKCVIGGGDSVAAIQKIKKAAKQNGEDVKQEFNNIYLSTGGGASLEFLEGKTLPGIAALNNKEKQKCKSGENGNCKSNEQQIAD